jgi:hypothetical protein
MSAPWLPGGTAPQADNPAFKAARALVQGMLTGANSQQQQLEDIQYEQGKMSYERYVDLLHKRTLATAKGTLDEAQALDKENQIIIDHYDRLYTAGKISNAEYMKILQERNRGLDEESAAYQANLQKINEITLTGLKNEAAFTGDNSKLRAYLTQRLAVVTKYSDEWYAVWQQIQEIDQSQLSRDVEHANAIGGGTALILRMLRERLRKVEQGSEEWFALITEIRKYEKQAVEEAFGVASAGSSAGALGEPTVINTMRKGIQALAKLAKSGAAEDVQGYFQGVADLRDKELAYIEQAYSAGLMSQQKYLANLNKMLNQVAKYSDAWWRIKDAIKSVEDEIKAYKAAFTDPIKEATDVLKNLSDQGKVTAKDIANYFDYMITASNRWNTAIQQLNHMGLNKQLLDDLAKMGPTGLNLAEELVRGGQGSVNAANQGYTGLQTVINQTGTDFGNIFPRQEAAIGQQVNFDVSKIDITITPGVAQVTKADVTVAITDAFMQLANQVR